MTAWNPWHGCKKVSEGCRNCYMYYLDRQRNIDSSIVHRSSTNFDLPLKKDRYGNYKIKSGDAVYVCLTSDFFIAEADEWRLEAWKIIQKRNDVEFCIITKRPERVLASLPKDWGAGWDNVNLIVTVENQARADERIPVLLMLPFKTKEITATPMLSEINIEKYIAHSEISQVTAGGENYDGARACHYEWIKSLYDQCVRNNVSFEFYETGYKFVKDSKLYTIPRLLQREQAIKSGLNYPAKENDVVIREKCRTCRNRYACKGCRDCNDCDRNG